VAYIPKTQISSPPLIECLGMAINSLTVAAGESRVTYQFTSALSESSPAFPAVPYLAARSGLAKGRPCGLGTNLGVLQDAHAVDWRRKRALRVDEDPLDAARALHGST